MFPRERLSCKNIICIDLVEFSSYTKLFNQLYMENEMALSLYIYIEIYHDSDTVRVLKKSKNGMRAYVAGASGH